MPTGLTVALKVVDVSDKGKREQLIKELRELTDGNCEHVVRYYNSYFADGLLHIALEYMDRGSIESVVQVRIYGVYIHTSPSVVTVILLLSSPPSQLSSLRYHFILAFHTLLSSPIITCHHISIYKYIYIYIFICVSLYRVMVL